MAKNELPSIGEQSFEDLKHVNDHGAEYWSARGLQSLLGYSQWRRFEDALKRAQLSCEQSGNDSAYHFAGAGKMVELGSGSQRAVEDFQLSRFACYLIAQNGDPRKPEIAQAQKYFAIQTRQFAGRYRSKGKRRITMILCCPLSLEPFTLSLSKGSPSTGSGRTVRNEHAQTGPYWIMTRTITLPLIAFHPHPA